MPDFSNPSKSAGLEQAGPIVQTILVLRMSCCLPEIQELAIINIMNSIKTNEKLVYSPS